MRVVENRLHSSKTPANGPLCHAGAKFSVWDGASHDATRPSGDTRWMPKTEPEPTSCSWCAVLIGPDALDVELNDGPRFLEVCFCSWAHAALWFAQGEPTEGPWAAPSLNTDSRGSTPLLPQEDDLACTLCGEPLPWGEHLWLEMYRWDRQLEPGFCSWAHASQWFTERTESLPGSPGNATYDDAMIGPGAICVHCRAVTEDPSVCRNCGMDRVSFEGAFVVLKRQRFGQFRRWIRRRRSTIS